MSDFALCIANALKKLFPFIKHGKCFFHLKENIRKHYRKEYKIIEEYINALGYSKDLQSFDNLWSIIKEDIKTKPELSEISETFIQYMEKTYLKTGNKNFYIGYLPEGFGNTNNMLEGHHRHLKQNIFERKKRSMGN